jgi:Putative auto-transporter adhesin, head GIN domain
VPAAAPVPDRDALLMTARAVAILAAVALLTGCLGTSGEPGRHGEPGTPGEPGSPGIPGAGGTRDTRGNGYGGDGGDANGRSDMGGTGGNGGNGYGGWGGNGYGGRGGDARGGNGAPGVDGADGVGRAPSGDYSEEDTAGSVAGSGRLTSHMIGLQGVTSVVVGAGFVVHLRIGGPGQATITMDDNLTDRVQATVIGDQLLLGLTPGASVLNATLSAEVTVGQLDRLATSGASRVMMVSALTSPTLQLVVAGASAVTGPVTVNQVQAAVSGAARLALSGQIKELRVSAAGTSQLPLADLTVGRLDVVLSGASHATVTVSDTLAAQTAGASVLHYRGAPTVTHQQISGASSIVRESP